MHESSLPERSRTITINNKGDTKIRNDGIWRKKYGPKLELTPKDCKTYKDRRTDI